VLAGDLGEHLDDLVGQQRAFIAVLRRRLHADEDVVPVDLLEHHVRRTKGV
jgi:hypothetical protein